MLCEVLAEVYSDDEEKATEILLFLSLDKNMSCRVPFYTLRSPQKIKALGDRLLQERKLFEDHEEVLRDLWLYLIPDRNRNSELVSAKTNYMPIAWTNFSTGLSLLSPEKKISFVRACIIILRKFGLSSLGTIAVLKKSSMKAMTITALIRTTLKLEAIKMIYEWYHGRADGRRCAAHIATSLSTVAAGVVAGQAVVSLSHPLGPVSLILGVAAGYYASHYANSLTDKLTQRIFGLAPTAALDRAYEFMMLSPNCTNAEVNEQYRKIALLYHPDKEWGSAEHFILLNSHMELIRAAREKQK
ncbi:hypothetical protein PROFUN_10617 [Planoprotostelium fungivorum]|uniref:J domain-containing protein n=1 Tax=Planoprotostelium fungivorum TaxID=1890364 RepID=A0A2P6ND82_9EUKA|nr:hypothetical protein PROFUN_10617 [Planoprotostelium fungivorum]